MALAQHQKQNFETLCRAVRDGNVVVMECQLAATQEVVAVICAVNSTESDELEFAPFAIMFSNDPYETVNPPNPDGGFYSQEEVWRQNG